MIGKNLSHYRILEEIHRGEIQVVYRARDEKLNREVALKVLPRDLVVEPARRQRFVKEAKASASLEHPHIAVIHEIDEVEDNVFIAMELFTGPSLAERMAEGALPVAESLQIATGIAAGLAYAHARGIVHRDLKPANVMLTEQGHPKLVDFGLAKMLDAEKNPFLGESGEHEGPLFGSTREESIEGTVSFMSPEQARGGRVDPRSDIFSFGLLLYSMLAGKPPFEGPTRIETLHEILREPTPSLSGLSSEERHALQPIIDRCLEKDPDLRFQSMAEVLERLRQASLQLMSKGFSAGKRTAVAVTATTCILAIVFFLVGRQPTAVDPAGKPSLAVGHFENLSGDPDLDWLRTGLTEMLVTDLARSRDLEVLSTDRLYQILQDMDRVNADHLTSDALEELTRRGGVQNVLLGSFARAGDEIRLSVRLTEPSTGKVLLSEVKKGRGEESIFRLVDEVTESVETTFSISAPREALEGDLRDVTTASVEAYREYAEGIRLHARLREEEAIPHFQRAIELDPNFSMALAKLGVVLSNIGFFEEADEYAERALANVDRLSERERFYIEGWYYSRKPETLERSIEAYRHVIELYPNHAAARHNLGSLLLATEDYEQAIEVLENLRRDGMPFPATHEQLAMAYKAVDEVGRASEILSDYIERNPEDWTTLVSLAQLRVESGDVDAGLEILERAEERGASSLRTAPVRWEAQIRLEEWDDALETAEALLGSDGPLEKSFGWGLLGTTALYRGRVSSVLSGVEDFLQAPENRRFRSQPLLFKARLLLDIGKLEQARETALALRAEDPANRYDTSRPALVVAAVASARLGDEEQAKRLAERFRDELDPAVGRAPERLFHLMSGELAMARSRYQDALPELYDAESMLPPRGTEGAPTVIWYALASAHRRAGNRHEAMRWYERITDATEERIFEPIRYVRSFYYLGRLHEEAGHLGEASEYYERFLEHWEDGDIDAELVRDARAKLDD